MFTDLLIYQIDNFEFIWVFDEYYGLRFIFNK